MPDLLGVTKKKFNFSQSFFNKSLMIFKKIIWAFKRHPFLYLTRFRLLSKNSSISDIKRYTYNSINAREDIPNYFFEINKAIFKNSKPKTDLELVEVLSSWLVNNIKGGPGLSVPSEEALKIMIAGEGGVCSDMVQIFNNFCVINDVKVREWGATRAPFDRNYGGHSYNEVYCRELNKWVLVDVSYCIMFYSSQNKEPLSVVELYQFLKDKKEIYYNSFNNSFNFDDFNIEKNYLHPDTIPFLVYNYSNKTYDSTLRKLRPLVPIFIIHFGLYIFNKSYYYKFPLNDYKKIFS